MLLQPEVLKTLKGIELFDFYKLFRVIPSLFLLIEYFCSNCSSILNEIKRSTSSSRMILKLFHSVPLLTELDKCSFLLQYHLI